MLLKRDQDCLTFNGECAENVGLIYHISSYIVMSLSLLICSNKNCSSAQLQSSLFKVMDIIQ